MPFTTSTRPAPHRRSHGSHVAPSGAAGCHMAQPASQPANEPGGRLDENEALDLFRRAVGQAESAAWVAVLEQYGPLVRHWVRQHPGAAALDEDEQDWVARAFEKFWAALRPNRLDRFDRLAAVLQYLKLCVHSVIAGDLRANPPLSAPALAALAGTGEARADAEAEDPARVVVGNAERQELWRTVDAALVDDAERLLLHLTFVRGLPPREVQARAPERFPSVADVYRVKRNVLDRLRRNPAVCRFRAA